MRKKVLLVTAVCVALLASSCSKNDSRDRKNPFNLAEQATRNYAEASEESFEKASEEMPLKFGDFTYTDKHPNSSPNITFDENHIYYEDDGIIYRINYDGTNRTEIAYYKGHDLRVYNGNLMFYTGDDSYFDVKQINLSTLEEKTILSSKYHYCFYDIESTLLCNGYYFISIGTSNKNAPEEIFALDLNNGTLYQLHRQHGGDYSIGYQYLTCDNLGNVYVLFQEKPARFCQVLSIDTNSISSETAKIVSNPMIYEDAEEFSNMTTLSDSELYLGKNHIYANNGIMCYDGDGFKCRLYSSIRSTKKYIECEVDYDNTNYNYNCCVFDNNSMVFTESTDNGETITYFSESIDGSEYKNIGASHGTVASGMHNNTIYRVTHDYLITISSAGDFTRHSITD